MCMVAAAVTKDFGVMAADASKYDTNTEAMVFESPRLGYTPNMRYLISYVGTDAYFANLDLLKFSLPLDQLGLYLQEYLRAQRPKVEELQEQFIRLEDEKNPHVCLFVMGLFKKTPTLAMFNSYKDFKPEYIWTKDRIKFGTIYYGGEIPGKKELFTEATAFMEKKAAKYEVLTPGLVGEVLTRGIYKKADMEEKIGEKRKYAGGAVAVGVVHAGGIAALNGITMVGNAT
jgi:hypothetical protein